MLVVVSTALRLVVAGLVSLFFPDHSPKNEILPMLGWHVAWISKSLCRRNPNPIQSGLVGSSA